MKGKHVLGTVWYIFRFQDGYELPEHGGLLGLFALEACFQRCWTPLCWEDSDPASLDEHGMKPSFLVFRRHWVAVAGSECRERPWNRLLLDKDVICSVYCKSLISNTQFQCILFCFVLQIGSRAVLITGCDSGFGFTLAKHLHDKGFIIYAGCLQKVGKTKTVLHLWHLHWPIVNPVFPLHSAQLSAKEREGGW